MSKIPGLILGVVAANALDRQKQALENQKQATQILRNTEALTAAGGKPIPWIANATYKSSTLGRVKEAVLVMATDVYEADEEIRKLLKLKAAQNSKLNVDTPRVATPEEYQKFKAKLEAQKSFEIGSAVRRTLQGAVGEVVAVDGEAVSVKWPDNRTTVHLSRDLKASTD
jgi:hypothetical protein